MAMMMNADDDYDDDEDDDGQDNQDKLSKKETVRAYCGK